MDENNISITSDKENATSAGCFVCRQNAKDEQANVFCLDCGFHMCRNCLNDHNMFPALTTHKVVNGPDEKLASTERGINKTPEEVEAYSTHHRKSQGCQVHNGKVIDTFCAEHDKVCCEVCVQLKHSGCKTVMPIKDVSIDRLGNDLHEFHSLHNALVKNIAEKHEEIMRNIHKLDGQKGKAIESIGIHEEMIIKRVRELADASRQKVSDVHDTHVNLIKSNIRELEKLQALSEENIKRLLYTDSNDIQAFVTLKTCYKVLKDSKKADDRLSTNWLQAEIGFSLDNTILDITRKESSLGKVIVETKNDAAIEANLEYKSKLPTSRDPILSACILNNRQLIVFKSKKIIKLIYEQDSTEIPRTEESERASHNYKAIPKKYRIGLPKETFGPIPSCVTGKQEVAFAYEGYEGYGRQHGWKIQFVFCDKPLRLASEIDITQRFTGLCYNDEKEELYVCCISQNNKGKLKVFKKNGVCLRSLSLNCYFERQSRLDLSPCQIVYSPSCHLAVFAYSGGVKAVETDGTVRWTYTDIKQPSGVFFIFGDQFLISGSEKDRFVHLNKDGNIICEFKLQREQFRSWNYTSRNILTYDPFASCLVVQGYDELLFYKLVRKGVERISACV